MQTIEEYKEYTKQLEGEVGKWHNSYDALMVERNQLVNRIRELETENKSAKNEKIDTLYQKSLARLEELVNKKYPDEEEDHSEADGILCDMLNALGYKDLTDAWDKIGKWYS